MTNVKPDTFSPRFRTATWDIPADAGATTDIAMVRVQQDTITMHLLGGYLTAPEARRLALALLAAAEQTTRWDTPAHQEAAGMPPESASTGPTGSMEGPRLNPLTATLGDLLKEAERWPDELGCGHDPDRIENDEVTADEHERTCLADPATRTVGWHITPGATTDTIWGDPQ